MLGRLPHPMIDGLTAALVAHNAGRTAIRAQVDREAATVLDQLSETTLGELFERFGLRAPLRAVTTRHGARVVALVRARLPAAP